MYSNVNLSYFNEHKHGNNIYSGYAFCGELLKHHLLHKGPLPLKTTYMHEKSNLDT